MQIQREEKQWMVKERYEQTGRREQRKRRRKKKQAMEIEQTE
jgi:hypothetical protein